MPEAADNPLLRAAIWYADLGYPVFPCVPAEKRPLTEHGLLDATADAEQIERWWTEHPDANVAIRTDGLLVIDIDGPDNPWLADQPDRLLALAAAPTSLTPRGGRQFIFRQPFGKAWRNTAGRLAPHVDTRANGGYILVASSVFNGKTYRWADGQPLDLSPNRLPEPPAWLTESLDRITEPQAECTPRASPLSESIPHGQRNATLARLAGVMRRAGMSATEILASLNRVNIERCRPCLDAREVAQIAGSIARYEPDAVSVALIEDHYAQDHTPLPSEPQFLDDLLDQCPRPRDPIIVDLLRQGETMNVIAPSKIGKSWLVLSLAMAVATGRPWLDTFKTVPGRVLILDNELHRETISYRVPQVAAALQIGRDEIGKMIGIESLRGRLVDIFAMRPYFEALEPGRFSMIVLDASYRFMPRGMDENDNGTMAAIYNLIDALADRLRCCFVIIHHSTKGNQSQKSVTDVGAGAGSQSRAADTHLVMRPHEEPHAVVLDAAARSWPPIEPLVLRWEFPVWRPAYDLDPGALRSEKPKRRKEVTVPDEPVSSDWTVEQFVEAFISDVPASKAEIREAAQGEPGLSWRRVADMLEIATSRGLIHRWHVGRAHRAMYATIPQMAGEEAES